MHHACTTHRSDIFPRSNAGSTRESPSRGQEAASTASLSSVLEYLRPLYFKLPLHDSPQTGAMILDRWLNHPNNVAMHAHLGLSPHAFRLVFAQLVELGELRPTKYISAELKFAIFLYICRGALGVRHTAETFQVSFETVGK